MKYKISEFTKPFGRIFFRLKPVRFIYLFLLCCQPVQAGSWNSLQIRHSFNNSLSIQAEGQLRSLLLYDHFHYHEYKAWLLWKWRPDLVLGLGAGDYDTYRSGGDFLGPKNNDEFRLWPQVQVQQQMGLLKIEHRYRYEMRFTSNGYRNRFRYRFQLSHPVVKSGSRLHVQASCELFFTNRAAYFERIRSQAGLSVKINDHLSLMPGYLYQFDYRINDETGRDFLVMGLVLDL